jgi:hypothetical protein
MKALLSSGTATAVLAAIRAKRRENGDDDYVDETKSFTYVAKIQGTEIMVSE